MLQHRAIPCLLLKGDGLVKTVRFAKPKYLGDPINAVKLFNDLEADELFFLDITATPEHREPHFERVREIVSEAFMPVGYGGGVRTVAQAGRLFQLGVEKVAVTTAAAEIPTLVTDLAREFGSQSIVAGLDVKRTWLGKSGIAIRCGKRKLDRDPVRFATQMEERGAGELLINSIDRDGTQSGYDLDLIRSVADAVTIPIVACGGAGSIQDLGEVTRVGASAAAAGSLFVFSGPQRAVLINYPSASDLAKVFETDGKASIASPEPAESSP